MDMTELRRAALRAFVADVGGHAAAVRKYRLTPSQASYLSQLVADGSTASFGERAASNWEQRFNMRPGRLARPSESGSPASSEPDEFAFVKRVDVQFSNGVGAIVYHEDEKPPLVFRRDFLRKLGISEGNAVVVDAVGNSNWPKIADGSVVLINKGDNTRLAGDLFAFRADGELLIKRLEQVPGAGILASAENPDFKPKTKLYRGDDDFEVIGKAVWAGATL